MSRLVLVRHGETIWHAENRYAGRSDVGLTPRGVEQARDLAKWAATAGLSAVWSSPLSRARLTAQPAAEAAQVPLHIDEYLIEVDFGAGEGLTGQEMHERFPQARAAFLEDPVRNPLPGSENPAQAARRGAKALQNIASISGEARVLVVAHNTLLRLVLCEMLQIPLSRYRETFPELANGALTELRINGGSTSLLSLNLPLSGTNHGNNYK
jgi:broad specificity phosphatase PhoE